MGLFAPSLRGENQYRKCAISKNCHSKGIIMKLRNSSRQRGGAVVIALFTVGILGISLASYLSLVRAQNLSTVRSQAWNSALPLAEAGVEEAFAQIYYFQTNVNGNGWSPSGTNAFSKTRQIGTGSYTASITPTNPPSIRCTGSALLQEGNFSTGYVSRTVFVTTSREALFAKAMVAKGQIDFNGNNIKTDSFDSADPSYSSGGQYNKGKTKDNGDV